MNRPIQKLIVVIILLLTAFTFAAGQKPEGTMAFTVSMDQPNTHYYHVTFRCEGIKSSRLDFKMPVWTPGYYWIQNFPKNVLNFRAEDGERNILKWEKTTKNMWRVASGNAQRITVNYDVYAFTPSVADPFLDDGRGFISPAGVFMHIEGRLRHPVTVTVIPYKEWKCISTGLDPVADRPNTFFAKDFDALYDCPFLLGNQEILTFEARGILHRVAIENPGTFDREKFLADLKRMVEAGMEIIDDVPYKHYTFLIMGRGMGGLEHRNSMAVFSGGSLYFPEKPDRYKDWLSFLAHEYFHLYNIKSIRPVALGPFDYDKENYTRMLWVSEGITVYYEYLILNRAGLMTREDCLERLRNSITNYENIPGHLFQSVTESSFDTWIQFFNRSENSSNTAISYYDKGCALGLLLDLKIRHETQNKKSLDDVMRTLYRKFFKEKERGFTDGEFRAVCEQTAGCPLPEIFDIYAPTVKDIEYSKYIAYAGLHIDDTLKESQGAYFGVAARERGGNIIVSSVEWDSPAYRAGISAQDTIIAIGNVRRDPQALQEIIKAGKPGDTLKVAISHRNLSREYEIVLGQKRERSFRMTPMTDPDPLQLKILMDWLKE